MNWIVYWTSEVTLRNFIRVSYLVELKETQTQIFLELEEF